MDTGPAELMVPLSIDLVDEAKQAGGLKRTTQHLGDYPSHGFGGGQMQRRRADHGRRLSHEDHVEIQRRVSEGETFASAAAAVGCSTKSIQRFMARTGGMLPRSRARSPLRLSLADREELSRGRWCADSARWASSGRHVDHRDRRRVMISM